MPSAVKNSANMTKHLTQAELEARRQAEEEVLPQRQKAKLKKPGFISGSRQANAYWNQILKRMEGLALLDDLDSEMLAGYCSMLARRDQTITLISQLMDRLGVAGGGGAREAPEKKTPPPEGGGGGGPPPPPRNGGGGGRREGPEEKALRHDGRGVGGLRRAGYDGG